MSLIRKISPFVVVLAGFLTLVASVEAGGDGCAKQGTCAEGKGGCPLQAKVTSLLAGWETARTEAAAMSEADRAQFASECAAVCKECPIGKRMGFTMKTVRGVLASAVAAEEACKANCPMKKEGATAEAAPAGLTPEIMGLMTARSEVLRGLNQLAGYACESMSGSCSKSACDKSAPAVAKASDCASKQDCASMCPIQNAVALGELKAKWAGAQADIAALTPEKKQALFAGFASITQKSKAVALMPDTFATLIEGFETLEKIDAKISEWGNANPEFMKSIPAESRISFQLQNAVISQTAEILRSAKSVMSGMCEGAPCEKPAAPATALNN